MNVGKAENENHYNFGQKEIGYFYSCVLVTQSCPTLCDPIDCSPPGSSVYGIFRARILEWVAISFSWKHVEKHVSTSMFIMIRLQTSENLPACMSWRQHASTQSQDDRNSHT